MQALGDKLERNAIGSPHQPGKTDRISAAQDTSNFALAALTGAALADRFRHWRGASGRRYVFSVYDPTSCPAYDDVVLAVVAKEGGARRVVSIVDTGALPELAAARAREAAASLGAAVECHIHLLAASKAERAAVIADLCPA